MVPALRPGTISQLPVHASRDYFTYDQPAVIDCYQRHHHHHCAVIVSICKAMYSDISLFGRQCLQRRLRRFLVCVLHIRVLSHLHEHQQLCGRRMPSVLGCLVACCSGRRRRDVLGHVVAALLLPSPDVYQDQAFGQKREALTEEGSESAMDKQDYHNHYNSAATTACKSIVGTATIFLGTLMTTYSCSGRNTY